MEQWKILMHIFKGFETAKWTSNDWRICPGNVTDIVDRNCRIQYMRSVHGHKRGQQQSNVFSFWLDWLFMSRWIYVWLQVYIRRSQRRWNRISRGTTDVLLFGSGSHESIDADTTIRTEPAENISIQITMVTNAQPNLLVWFATRAKQRMVLWQKHHQRDHIKSFHASRLLGKSGLKKIVRYWSRSPVSKVRILNNEKLHAFDYKKISAIIVPGDILCQQKEFLSGWIQWLTSGSMVFQKELSIKIRLDKS